LLDLRVGLGVDAHKIVADRPLWLGGVEIEADFGLEAHSDGDVIAHAILDALLGALDLGDKGKLFPPTDPAYKDIRSTQLLHTVMSKIRKTGYVVCNVDVSVMCEEPKIASHVNEMKNALSKALNMQPEQLSIKGTTLEHLGFTGRKEGIAAMAVVLMQKIQL
jgi:2-C-methyl-D-erythritol 2,4-cyclodiphosphate synthase